MQGYLSCFYFNSLSQVVINEACGILSLDAFLITYGPLNVSLTL